MTRSIRLVPFLFAAALLALMTACGPEYPKCEADKHCAKQNEVCVNGFCRQCRDDAQCAQIDPCQECGANNACVRRAGCCKSDLDCPGGRCWKDTPDAVTGTCGGLCRTDDHCPDGQRCAGGSCVPDVACTGDAQCPAGQRCVNNECVAACDTEAVYFDFNEYTIRLSEEQKVRDNATCIRERAAAHQVSGHADERGSDEYNLALGQRRANAVARQYRQLGVTDDLISTISYGEERPVCNQSNEECWQQNRRVETERR